MSPNNIPTVIYNIEQLLPNFPINDSVADKAALLTTMEEMMKKLDEIYLQGEQSYKVTRKNLEFTKKLLFWFRCIFGILVFSILLTVSSLLTTRNLENLK
ncbi:hypothetical protein Glove_615g7 [Diversispora epigaea]|uniref:Uncharacterized protein n=1 Tax=Diversispora epigaea TaxID=1348612 RepID=A0A397GAB6_9GLOM|nr:hypothetical protein Glove_615g7 [Diversispora epigaea]